MARLRFSVKYERTHTAHVNKNDKSSTVAVFDLFPLTTEIEKCLTDCYFYWQIL